MDTTTSSTVNSGFVGIKFCQEWFVQVLFIYLEYFFIVDILAIICYIQKKIKKIVFYSMR